MFIWTRWFTYFARQRRELLLTIKRETSGGGRKMPVVVGKEPEAVSWVGE